jgi:hypothetical protein
MDKISCEGIRARPTQHIDTLLVTPSNIVIHVAKLFPW